MSVGTSESATSVMMQHFRNVSRSSPCQALAVDVMTFLFLAPRFIFSALLSFVLLKNFGGFTVHSCKVRD